jgi:two-component system response regulator NreC
MPKYHSRRPKIRRVRTSLTNGKIRVMLADDHPVVLAGVKNSLQGEKDLEVVGEATDGDQTLEVAKLCSPDVILLDINMPKRSGIEIMKSIRRLHPRPKVIAFSMYDDKDLVLAMVKAGVDGYVLKETAPSELTAIIRSVYHGESVLSPKVSRTVLEQMRARPGSRVSKAKTGLTDREHEVLVSIVRGLSNKEIADVLGIGIRTVETHRERIMSKLNIHNVADLTRYAISKGIIELS